MAIKDYKFVSPGVQIKEIDQSVLDPAPPVIGPVVVGRFLKGPAMVPTIVSNIDEFRDVFGGTITGQEKVSDVWREGNDFLAPSYASIAAEAHLDAAVSPITVVRLLGQETETVQGTAGQAGWKLPGGPNSTLASNSCVYALVLNKLSGSGASDFTAGQGFSSSSYVAAYFYVSGAALMLEGSHLTSSSTVVSGSGVWVKAQSTALTVENGGTSLGYQFKAIVDDGTNQASTIFCLDPNQGNFIRKVFNTNPTLTNSAVVATSGLKKYWLGESFSTFISDNIGDVGAGNNLAAVLVPLKSLDNVNPADYNLDSQASKTGWIFSQHLNASSSFPATEAEYLSGSNNKVESQVQKLFRFASISTGDYEQKNYKILISNIQPPKNLDKYATFDVSVVVMNSLDSNMMVKEEFTGLNLDKSSPNYIAKRIGDKYYAWSYNEDRLIEYNDNDNQSSIIRVEVDSEITNGKSTEGLMPFGVFGPPRAKKIDSIFPKATETDNLYIFSGSYARKSANGTVNDNSNIIFGMSSSAGNLTSSIVFPRMSLVGTINRDLGDNNSNYFGINKGIKSRTGYPFDAFHTDLLRPLGGPAEFYAPTGSSFEYSYVFTLDDVSASSDSKTASWAYGNRYASASYTAQNGNGKLPVAETALASRLAINNFMIAMHGGHNGFDVREVEPLRNTLIAEAANENTSCVFNTYKVGIQSVKDPEVVNMNVLAVPGLTNKVLTQLMIDTCQQRADALALVDLEGDFTPSHENATFVYKKPENVKSVISKLKARNINSSYAAAYFPWVQVSVTKPQELARDVWVPPSVVALGTFASSEAKSQLWFAPAGFNRGGLREVDQRGKYTAGFKVLNTAIQLTSKQRDQLYEVNINPIANFVNEGIVVFGQKTLQVIPSALDRINVRRLLIFLKKRVSLIASGILFDPNVDVTWARFTTATNDFLKEVKAGLGLVDYKIVLDKTTTTDELIDRNILYAKIYLKPARAIEFIAVDFIITKSGASFAD